MGIRIQSREIEVPADDPFRDDLLGRREAWTPSPTSSATWRVPASSPSMPRGASARLPS